VGVYCVYVISRTRRGMNVNVGWVPGCMLICCQKHYRSKVSQKLPPGRFGCEKKP
jgi:hypothetical protein